MIEFSAEMEAAKRTRRGAGDAVVKKGEDTLDAEVWGALQNHIPLHTVCEKLPILDRLQLRVVCKAWNHSVLQRLEPKPYFVIITAGCVSAMGTKSYSNGLVKYDVATGKFSFERLPFPLRYSVLNHRLPPFEVDGLIFCYDPDALNQQCVFNVHTKTWHIVPPAPETSDFYSICGMMVDTSEKPYSFKLVLGSPDKKTQIYDSRIRSWSTTSSMLYVSAAVPLDEDGSYSCMCHDGCVYMSVGQQMTLVYSIEEDSWTTLDFPGMTLVEDRGALGVWDGRIFTVKEDIRQHNISVWELVDPKKQEEWVEYARCSEYDYRQIMFGNQDLDTENMLLLPFFCDEYLLVCNWQYEDGRANALMMFHMKTKKWEQVGLPTGILSIADEGEEDSEFGEEETEVDCEGDFDDEDDVDEVDEDDVDEVDFDEDVDDDGAFDNVDDVDNGHED